MLRKIEIKTILLLAIVLLCTNSSTLNGQILQNNNTIQIVSSSGYDNEWGQILAKKIKRGLQTSINGTKVNIIYSGVEKANSILQAREMVSDSIWKQATPKLMVIIGYEALMTIKSYDDPLLKSIPIIVCGVEKNICANYDYYLKNNNVPTNLLLNIDSVLKGYNAIAITTTDNSAQTVKLISLTFPNVQNIIYLSELTYSDFIYTKRIDSIIGTEYPSINFSTIKAIEVNNAYINSIENKIDKHNTAIILNNYNTSDNIGKVNPLPLNNFNSPVFTLKYKYINSNTNAIVGGIFEPIKDYASAVTSTAIKLLNGTNINTNKTDIKQTCIINKTAATNFKLKTDKASNITFVNFPSSKIGIYFLAAILIIALLVLLIVFLILIIRLIRKRKRLKLELEKISKSLQKDNLIYKNIPIGIATFNNDGLLNEGNVEFMKMINIIIPDFKHSNEFNIFNSGLVTSTIISKIANGEISERNVVIESNNTKINSRIIFTPIILKKENSILVIIYDTTQINKERQTRDSINTVFNKAITESRLGVAEIDLISGTCVATDGWYKALGVLKESSIEKCLINIVKEDKDNIFKFIEKAICNNSTKTVEDIRIMNSDSTIRWVKIILKIKECNIEDKNIICSAVLIDIDARKQREEQLKGTYFKIIKANSVKNSFISNMSHEVRTPLNAIIGFSELLIESQDIDEQKELLKYLEENNDKFLKLITEIIDVSKIESGSVKCTLSEIDLNEVFSEIANGAAKNVNKDEVKIIFTPKENGIVYSDKERLQQVLEIFMSNALKYTKKGHIELGYKLLQKKVQLYVSDTGCGIAEDKRDKLFNRFSKLNKEYIGLGLGLPIAHSIVKLLSGDIGFETEINKGSTFWCTIPSEYLGMDSEIGLTGKLENATRYVGSNLKTILIAEDNENNFQLLNFLLKGKFKIVHAVNGEKAVELYKTCAPDIILMDIKMPVMDGYQATAAIREISKDIPIIAVTAYAFNKDKEKILDSSFTAFIAKPVRENELIESINSVLNK
ncbi:MAG: response regulator [Bacteroidales bacterium]